MAGGSSNKQPTKKSPDKTPEAVEQTTAEATLTIMQALKLQFDSLSTRLEIQEEINRRSNPATDDDDGEGGNGPVHDARAVGATEDDDGDDCGEFIDPAIG
eukprot:jgi/Tetstr1/421937/TSEL_012836.t1